MSWICGYSLCVTIPIYIQLNIRILSHSLSVSFLHSYHVTATDTCLLIATRNLTSAKRTAVASHTAMRGRCDDILRTTTNHRHQKLVSITVIVENNSIWNLFYEMDTEGETRTRMSVRMSEKNLTERRKVFQQCGRYKR